LITPFATYATYAVSMSLKLITFTFPNTTDQVNR
jgi:hypothetical protein